VKKEGPSFDLPIADSPDPRKPIIPASRRTDARHSIHGFHPAFFFIFFIAEYSDPMAAYMSTQNKIEIIRMENRFINLKKSTGSQA